MTTVTAATKYAAVPAELKARPRWVAYQLVDTGKKRPDGSPHLDKVPKNPNTEKNAAGNDPTTCSTFDQALAAVERYGYDGVSYLVTDDDPYAGIDLDNCRNPETGEMADWAQAIIDRLGSYTEVSPSGTGVHLLVRGILPPGGRKKGAVEMYDSRRFFTVTGEHVAGTPTAIERRPAELLALHAVTFGESKTQEPRQPRTLDRLEDSALLKRAFAARNGERVRRLWDGDTSEHGGDESAADLALVSSLAFYTDDAAQIERLWLASPIGAREKTQDRRDYRERTIAKALSNTPIRPTPLSDRVAPVNSVPGKNGPSPVPCPDVRSSATTSNPCDEQVTELERLLSNRNTTIATLQRERDEARAVLSTTWAVIRNPDIPVVDRLLTVCVIQRCMQVNTAQDLPYDAPVPITIAGGQDQDGRYPEASLCSQLGLREGRVSPALKRVNSYGFMTYDVGREPVQTVDRDTGELVPAIDPATGKQRWRSVAQFQLRKEPIVALQEFARYRPPVASDPLNLGAKPAKQPAACPTHGPDAPTVTATTCAVGGCGTILDVTRKPGRGAFTDSESLNLKERGSGFGAPTDSVDQRINRTQISTFSLHEQAEAPLRAREYFPREDGDRPETRCRSCGGEERTQVHSGEWECLACGTPPGAGSGWSAATS